MPISHVGSVAGSGNTTTSETHTINFATAAGDIIIVSCTNGGANANGNTPSGTVVSTGGVVFAALTSLNGGGTTTLTGVIWWGRARGDHNTQTIITDGWTDSGSSNVTVLRGCERMGNPWAATNSALCASGVNSLSALTAAGIGGSWLVLALACDNNIASSAEAATDPGTVTERAEHLTTGGANTANTLCAEAMTGTGSTGTITWTNARGAGIYLVALGAIMLPDDSTRQNPHRRNLLQPLLAH